MSGRAAFARRGDAVAAEQTAEGLAAEREVFLLDQFFVGDDREAGISSASCKMRVRVRSSRWRGLGAGRQVPLDALRDNNHTFQFLLTQRECLLSHGVTFSRCC